MKTRVLRALQALPLVALNVAFAALPVFAQIVAAPHLA
jgi:hypothetical protein